MDLKQNIFVAKRNLVDYIFRSAKLEGLSVTFPDTQTIIDGLSVANVPVDEIIAINNLKKAWMFVFDTIGQDMSYAMICKLNQIVGEGLIYNAGYIRSTPVRIGGTEWKPELPIESQVKEELDDINQIQEPTERAIVLMLYIMRRQMFLDGNKRVAMLAANHIMIQNGCGIISIPLERQNEFREKLISFYETNNLPEAAAFVYEYGIDGMDLEPERARDDSEEELEI